MDWRARLQTIAATATLTSAAWIVALAAWSPRAANPPAQSVSQPAPAPPATSGNFMQMRPQEIPRDAPPLIIPVTGVQRSGLIDTFSQARDGGARPHDAIDIMAPQDTPVVAAAPGTVEKLFYSTTGGITAYIRSPDRRWIYYYAHLAAYAPGLREGQQLAAGAPVGTVGYSGNADPAAPHLHFAVHYARPDEGWHQGRPINPYPLLQRR